MKLCNMALMHLYLSGLDSIYSEIFFQRFFGNTIFSWGFWGRSPKGHNRELWRMIFSCKHVWMAWVGVFYYGKCNYYVPINCTRHCVREEFIPNYFRIFSFLLTWDKNLGSHTGWLVAKPLWIHPWFKIFLTSCLPTCCTRFYKIVPCHATIYVIYLVLYIIKRIYVFYSILFYSTLVNLIFWWKRPYLLSMTIQCKTELATKSFPLELFN